MDNKDNSNDVLLNLELQIEDDVTTCITIRENDDIDEIVDSFCEEHGYDEEVRKLIMDQLIEALNNNIQQCKKNI
jgi:hypothetical protein